MTATPQSAEQAVLDYLREHPETTVDQLANGMGIGRTSARKRLVALIREGKAERAAGRREGSRRLPDRFTAKDGASEPEPDAPAEPRKGLGKKRLRPGELDGLVLAHMHEREDDLPLTASAIGKGIGRSSGAVANCLVRLAKDKTVREAKRKPRAYALKARR